MSPAEAALLGLLQGLTEFLPVSSSGHLVLGQALLGVRLPGVRFEVVMHMATLAAVLFVYRQRAGRLCAGLVTGRTEAWGYLALLAVASLPAAAAGLLARAWFESAFERPVLVASLLLLSGAFAWLIDRAARDQMARRAGLGLEPEERPRERPSLLGALAVGGAQALAILPGISRSGSTVAVGATSGVDVIRMAEFSFLLSVPAIAGAAVLQVAGSGGEPSAVGALPMAVGFVTAAVSGAFAIHGFLRLLRTRHFRWFAYYCWLIGGGYLVAAALAPSLR